MKITMLSEKDYAGSGYKLYEAIKRYTDHDIEFYSGKYYNPYNHPRPKKIDRRKLQKRIDESDIVHLKGDWPPYDGYMKVKIMHKPVVITVSGSHFRRREDGGHGRFDISDYNKAILKTAFTPDICYGEFVWTPHPVDSRDKKHEWQKSSPPVVMHMPTNPGIKRTTFVLAMFERLREHGIKTLITSGMKFKEAVERRKKVTMFFDQFLVGFYGNSAIEAMQYGVPVAAWVKNPPEGCPVITSDGSIDTWIDKLVYVLAGDMKDLSEKTKQWCDNVHSYQAVANRWNDLYDVLSI